MNKYATGPWRYDPDNLNVYANGLLAQVYGHIHTGEKEANARLIAAAPEMLEALKSTYSMLFNESLAENQPWANVGLDRIRKAIAKAEGRES